MEKIHNWGGAFLPLRKHRDGCGVTSNHIKIVAKAILDEEETEPGGEDEFVNEDGYSADELTVINEGEGTIALLVSMEWKHWGGVIYQYIMMIEDEVPEDIQIAERLAQYIEEENARRRAREDAEITDGSDPFAD